MTHERNEVANGGKYDGDIRHHILWLIESSGGEVPLHKIMHDVSRALGHEAANAAVSLVHVLSHEQEVSIDIEGEYITIRQINPDVN